MSNTNPNQANSPINLVGDFSTLSNKARQTSESVIARGIWDLKNDLSIAVDILPDITTNINLWALVSKVRLFAPNALDAGLNLASFTIWQAKSNARDTRIDTYLAQSTLGNLQYAFAWNNFGVTQENMYLLEVPNFIDPASSQEFSSFIPINLSINHQVYLESSALSGAPVSENLYIDVFGSLIDISSY